MKKFIMGCSLLLLFAIAGCKKDGTNAGTFRMTKIKYTQVGAPANNAEHLISYNSDGKITQIVKNGTSAGDSFIYKYYYSTLLDSVQKTVTSTGVVSTTAAVHWTSNRITSMWVLTYDYDGLGKLYKKIYTSGAYFQFDYSTDSIRYFYSTTALGTPYLEGSWTTDNSVFNPYFVHDNEAETKVFNFSLNSLGISELFSITPYMYNYGREYNPDGSLYTTYTYTFEGSTGGYPNKINFYDNGVLKYTYEFTYEPVD